MAPGAATLIVHLGQALAEWAGTAAAVDSGAISVAHAKVIVGFFAHLPDGVPPEALPECETYLLQAAATENPVELTRRAAALRHLLEPAEHSLPDAENTALNELFAATTLGGRGMVKADLDAETMEMLHTALSGLPQPKPAADGTRDTRPAALRRAEAFTELLRRYLNSGHSPTEGYERPHLSLLIRDEDLAAAKTTTRMTPLPMRHPPRTPPPAPPLTAPPLTAPAMTAAPTAPCSVLTRWHRDGCPGSDRSPRPAPDASRVTANSPPSSSTARGCR